MLKSTFKQFSQTKFGFTNFSPHIHRISSENDGSKCGYVTHRETSSHMTWLCCCKHFAGFSPVSSLDPGQQYARLLWSLIATNWNQSPKFWLNDMEVLQMTQCARWHQQWKHKYFYFMADSLKTPEKKMPDKLDDDVLRPAMVAYFCMARL